MKRVYITAALTALAVLIVYNFYHPVWSSHDETAILKVGFIYDGDDSTPDTYNFAMAEDAVRMQFPDSVETLSVNNVLADEAEDPLRDMVSRGCGVIFTNVFSTKVAKVAQEYPEVQFCQVSQPGGAGETPSNFHTFNAQMAPARYVAGVAAGMKLREMIDAGELSADQALVGYVGAAAEPQVISGFTAFLIGVRTAAPEARMLVKYAGAWCDYSREKAAAEAEREAAAAAKAEAAAEAEEVAEAVEAAAAEVAAEEAAEAPAEEAAAE